MITFVDGPAKGQSLLLVRSPIFLRVVCLGAKWDALDQPGDVPELGERVYAYRVVGETSWIHINRAGGKGGTYRVGDYAFIEEQPPDDVLRDNTKWGAYVDYVYAREQSQKEAT